MTDPRYTASTQHLARARTVTAGGAQTRSRAATAFVEGSFPAYLDYADGPYVWDLDGHKYVDWIGGLGSIGIGHADRDIHDHVVQQLSYTGASPSLPTTLEAGLAEALCAVIPSAQSVRFVKTGSEATEAAMRIARVATGRDVILSVGYHGWHSVHDATKKNHPGVPWQFELPIVEVPYNDLEALRRAFYEHDHRALGAIANINVVKYQVAAVILEPVLHDAPHEGYLQGVRDLCTRYGALLIFDEVVTGYRWALAGAQEYFGVTPDLSCFGKACANGFPLAFVCGQRDIMEAGAGYVSSTHGGEPGSLAAGLATLRRYQQEPIIARIWEAGRALQEGVNVLGGPITIGGYPCKPRPIAVGETQESRDVMMSLWIQECAARGVLFHPTSLSPMAAHDGAAVALTMTACAEAMAVCALPDPASRLRGAVIKRAFVRDAGVREDVL